MDLTDALTRFAKEARAGVCDTGRYRCRYSDWGDGPALVFVHGLSDVGRSFAPVMARLAGRVRCVAYDLPDGNGDGADLRRYRHPALAADLLALLDHLGLARAAVLGSSFGSTVALAALAGHPDRLTAGVLAGGFAHRPLRLLERLLAWSVSFTRADKRMRDAPHRAKMAELDAPVFADAPPGVWEFFRETTGEPPCRAVARRALMLHALDLRPRLAGVRQPVLMIGGDGDRIVPKRDELEALRGLPNARRVEFERCGHYPQFTHPDRFAAEVAAFLTRVG